MKILIASEKNEAARQLSSTLGAAAPQARFLHAPCAETALGQLSNHKIDIALVDIHLLTSSPAATYILRLAHPEGVLSAMLRDRPNPNQAGPGLLLTFDGAQLDLTMEALIERLDRVAEESVRTTASARGVNLWAQNHSGEWESINSSYLGWAVAEQGRVEAHDRHGGVYLLRARLKELEKRLDSADFCRIHKSYLVNLNHVVEMQAWSSGGYLLLMNDAEGTRLPISRRFAAHLKERTGWKVGPVEPPASRAVKQRNPEFETRSTLAVNS